MSGASLMLERLRRSRESTVEIRSWKFRIRRPSEMAIAEMREANGGGRKLVLTREIVSTAVIGWEGVLERDIIPGESDQPADFDTELLVEWMADDSDLFTELQAGVFKAIADYRSKVEASAKN